MFTTMHWLPNRRAASRTNPDRWQAAELIETLSQPALSSARISSIVRIPPPTVSGMKTCSAVRRTTSIMMSRPSWLAVISRNTSSSAPSFSYRAATSTGSPASRKLTKFVPLTTRPRSTSRQGMTRFASIRRKPIAAGVGHANVYCKPGCSHVNARRLRLRLLASVAVLRGLPSARRHAGAFSDNTLSRHETSTVSGTRM